jgi:autotransporter-associated beta strand protein
LLGNIYLGSGGIVYGAGGGTKTVTISLSGGTFHTVDLGANTGGTQGLSSVLTDGANWTWSSDAHLAATLTSGTTTFAPDANRTITLNNSFSGSGGLAMTGPGTLVIGAANSYSGATTLSGGTVAGTGSLSGSVTATSGATITPGSVAVPGTLTLGTSLTLNGATNIIRLTADTTAGGANDLFVVNGGLTLSGISRIKIVPLASLTTTAPYTILQYSGPSLTAADAAHLQVLSDNPRVTYTVVDPSTTPGSIQVSVSGNSASLAWRGSAALNPNAWDHTTANWLNNGTSVLDVFYNGDATTFDDNGTVTAVNVIGGEQPVSISMANSAKSYVFSGDGLLSGPLDAEGSGALTLSLSQAPAFSAITLNSETLAFALSNGLVNTVSAAITGNGTLIQGGTNTLVLAADNSTVGNFTGTIAITNGVLQYATAASLGNYLSPLYATNTGSLDVKNIAPMLKNIIIAGDGYKGLGALMSSSSGAIANEGVHTLTLIGDASIGAFNRWDIYGAAGGGSVTGNNHKLTHLGPGTVIINSMGDIGVGDIHIVAGRMGFQGPVTMGDASKTLTVESNATLTFYSATNAANANGSEDKVLVLNGSTVFDSAGASNNFQGSITLVGTNNVFGLRSDLHLWNSIGGAGGMAVGASPVGAGTGTLWLEVANNYSGATVISNTYQIVVGASSSLGSSSLIRVDSGATLDVSAPASLSLGAGQTLSGAGTVIGGNVHFNTGSTLAPGFPDNNPYTLTMNGNLTLQSGSTNLVVVKKTTSVANDTVVGLTSVTMAGTLVINNVGNPLAAGDAIQLFSASSSYSISFANVIPTTPGSGLIWDYSTLNSDGKLRVIAIPQPDITDIMVGGGNVVLSGTNNGSASTHYVVFSSTNVTLPLNQWQPLVTNPFNPDGSFSWTYTIVPAETSRFYRLQLQ